MEKQTYSYDEAYKASLEYFKGDELAARVWVNKYAVKDSFGNIYEKSPVDMHWRIANEVARIEAKYPNALRSEMIIKLLHYPTASLSVWTGKPTLTVLSFVSTKNKYS